MNQPTKAFWSISATEMLQQLQTTTDGLTTLESVISASLIVLVIRSRKPFFKSRPAKYLSLATLLTVIVTLALPFTPLGEVFGFGQLPISFLLLLGIIVILYIVTAEVAKTVFYKKVKV